MDIDSLDKEEILRDAETQVLVAEEGDTIHDVAKFTGVNWKIIAVINDMTPPYSVDPGDELLAPKEPPSVNEVDESSLIDVLDLTGRAEGTLKKNGLETIGDLLEAGEELTEVKGIGPKTYETLKEKLDDLGFDLG